VDFLSESAVSDDLGLGLLARCTAQACLVGRALHGLGVAQLLLGQVIRAGHHAAQQLLAEVAVTLDAGAFSDALRQVVSAASKDEGRPVLTGVLLAAENDGLRLVATDSYRLAVRDLPGVSVLGAEQRVLVPARALNELQRVLSDGPEVTLRIGENDATFEIGGTRLSTRLIPGDFPNYRQLIPPSHPNLLTVNRGELLDAIRRMKILARDTSTTTSVLRLKISADSLQLDFVSCVQDKLRTILQLKVHSRARH
jgi:DNA polymerase-3 subunit beta